MKLSRIIFLTELIILGSFVTGCSRSQNQALIPSAYLGKRVGELMDGIGIKYQEFAFIDEPPGRLQDLVVRKSDAFGTNIILIRIRPVMASQDFSRIWPESLIREATIEAVQINPATVVR